MGHEDGHGHRLQHEARHAPEHHLRQARPAVRAHHYEVGAEVGGTRQEQVARVHAVRGSLPLSTQVLLEIPSAPLAVTNSLPKAARNLRARTIRVTHADGYHLVGLKFFRPLVNPPTSRASRPRKAASAL